MKILKILEKMKRALTRIRVSAHGERPLRGEAIDGKDLVMPRRCNHRIDVQFIDNVLRFVPPSFTQRKEKISH